MGQALKDTEAPIVYVANLANKPLHTQGYAVHDYAAEIERFIAPATLSMVVYNNEPPRRSSSKLMLPQKSCQ